MVMGGAAVWGWGLFSTSYHPVEESKLCYHALTSRTGKLEPQAREYLKTRLYSNAATWVSPSWIQDWRINFGPVDEAALQGLDAIKDAESPGDVYRKAMQKHGYKVQPD